MDGTAAPQWESQSSAVAAPEWEIRVSKLMTMRRSKMGMREIFLEAAGELRAMSGL